MKKNKIKILCMISYYLPGFKSGGPVRSISNLVNALNNDFEFFIITSDKDLHSSTPYKNIHSNEWNNIGSAKVYYLSRSPFNFIKIINLIKKTNFDIIYLNSFFNLSFTIIPLIARRFFIKIKAPFVIAPRGEFSKGALELKKFRKIFFLKVTKFIGLYKNLNWHASSKIELKDIKNNIHYKNIKIKVASDIAINNSNLKFNSQKLKKHVKKNLKIIFLSRISPMKNLDFLLNILKKVKSEINLSIYGPIEDKSYWKLCLELINKLPKNISVNYYGEVKQDSVLNKISLHDVLILPSRGENYGHIIIESLISGTPIIISNNTKWKSELDKSITVISLKEINKWVKKIEQFANYDNNMLISLKRSAKIFALKYLKDDKEVINNKNLFLSIYKNYYI